MAMASWTALAAALLAATPVAAPIGVAPAETSAPSPHSQRRARLLAQAPPPPPPLPSAGSSPLLSPPGSTPAPTRPNPAWSQPIGRRQGTVVRLQGQEQKAAWLWQAQGSSEGAQLWLPLEVLQNQLGFSSRSLSNGSLDLEWYGRGLKVPAAALRSLDDEVAVDVAELLQAAGVIPELQGERLELRLPAAQLLGVRTARQPGVRRVVLDLDGPAAVRSAESGLLLGLSSGATAQTRLAAQGLQALPAAGGLALSTGRGATPLRVFTLGNPARVVIDLPSDTGAGEATGSTGPEIDPRLQRLLGREVEWDRHTRQIAGLSFRINAVRLDPRSGPLDLRPLSRADGMEGLSSLTQLARSADALVAINGGYFNRVRQLPLGALRQDGRWLSGPILNRGAMGWDSRSLPRFGRLQLHEVISDRNGQRWPILFVNSGFVQRGLSRYTADWGPWYRALSGRESGLLLHQGQVVQRFDPARLAAGVRLGPGDVLIVARAGAVLPWSVGDNLSLESQPSDPVGLASNVVGGGPLLLLDGRIVLNGAAEGFGSAFLGQGAPRTVVGSDGRRLWLVTLEGVGQDGPTLGETALLLQRLGLRDALNLDGGSSTGLVMGGAHTVKGRGVAGSVHNGLGLVPSAGGSRRSDGMAGS